MRRVNWGMLKLVARSTGHRCGRNATPRRRIACEPACKQGLKPSNQGEPSMAKRLAPMHPGEVLREEFLLPLGLSPGALAKACNVPRTRIERLSNEETGVTADTALRLS